MILQRTNIIIFIAVAITMATGLALNANTIGKDDILKKVEVLVEKERSRSEKSIEVAWTRYRNFLIREKEAAIRKGDLELVNLLDKQIISADLHPDDWTYPRIRNACLDFFQARTKAQNEYIASIEKLISQQVRLRNLELANALRDFKSSVEGNAISIDQIVVDDFDGDKFEMNSYGGNHRLEISRTESPYESSRKNTQGLKFEWFSPHGDQIEAYYSVKRGPIIESDKPLNLSFRLWIEGSSAPSRAQVRFSDTNGEVFAWDQAIPDSSQSGWRKVTIPIDFKTSISSFGDAKNGVVDFPVSVQGYAFTFNNQQKPASWLLIDDVIIQQDQ
jgi:hypothetical protein